MFDSLGYMVDISYPMTYPGPCLKLAVKIMSILENQSLALNLLKLSALDHQHSNIQQKVRRVHNMENKRGTFKN